MHNTKLTTVLLLAGLTLACSAVHAAEGEAPAAPKPAPKTLPPASSKTGLTFAKDIKPLFDASCVRCHGEQKPKAALNLTTLEGTLAGSEEGKVITVGNSAKSDLVTAIARINPKTAMPPEPRGPRRPGAGPAGPAGGQGNEKKPEGAPAAEKRAEKPAGGAQGTNAPASGAPGNANRPPGGPGGGGPGGRNQGPPPKPLTAEEVGIVRAWIDQGAK